MTRKKPAFTANLTDFVDAAPAKKKSDLTKFGFELTHEQKSKLKLYAAQNGVTLANVFRDFVDDLTKNIKL